MPRSPGFPSGSTGNGAVYTNKFRIDAMPEPAYLALLAIAVSDRVVDRLIAPAVGLVPHGGMLLSFLREDDVKCV